MSDIATMMDASLHWKRPPGPLNVWRIKESTKKLDKDDKGIKFSIQEIPDDRYDDALDFMCNSFVRDEPICNSCNVQNDTVCLEDFRIFWKKILKQGVSVAAFVNDPAFTKPVIAGMNMLFIVTKEDDALLENAPMMCKSESGRKIFRCMMKLGFECDMMNIYNIDKYMSAFGLSVDPAYRGEKLGFDLLLTRNDIGRKFGVAATETIFTAPSSQLLAERAGFVTHSETFYDQLKDDDGQIAFPNMKLSKSVKVMHMKLA